MDILYNWINPKTSGSQFMKNSDDLWGYTEPTPEVIINHPSHFQDVFFGGVGWASFLEET